MTNLTRQLLVDAKALVADPYHWVKEIWSTDAHGDYVEPESAEARCFCSMGAMRRAVHVHVEANAISVYDPDTRVAYSAAKCALHNAARQLAGFSNMIGLNDEGTHKDVMQAFNLAIQAQEWA